MRVTYYIFLAVRPIWTIWQLISAKCSGTQRVGNTIPVVSIAQFDSRLKEVNLRSAKSRHSDRETTLDLLNTDRIRTKLIHIFFVQNPAGKSHAVFYVVAARKKRNTIFTGDPYNILTSFAVKLTAACFFRIIPAFRLFMHDTLNILKEQCS